MGAQQAKHRRLAQLAANYIVEPTSSTAVLQSPCLNKRSWESIHFNLTFRGKKGKRKVRLEIKVVAWFIKSQMKT